MLTKPRSLMCTNIPATSATSTSVANGYMGSATTTPSTQETLQTIKTTSVALWTMSATPTIVQSSE